jgi:hypothetical protein
MCRMSTSLPHEAISNRPEWRFNANENDGRSAFGSARILLVKPNALGVCAAANRREISSMMREEDAKGS